MKNLTSFQKKMVAAIVAALMIAGSQLLDSDLRTALLVLASGVGGAAFIRRPGDPKPE